MASNKKIQEGNSAERETATSSLPFLYKVACLLLFSYSTCSDEHSGSMHGCAKAYCRGYASPLSTEPAASSDPSTVRSRAIPLLDGSEPLQCSLVHITHQTSGHPKIRRNPARSLKAMREQGISLLDLRAALHVGTWQEWRALVGIRDVLAGAVEREEAGHDSWMVG